MPVKLNKNYWPKKLTNFLPSSEDPRKLLTENISSEQFSNAISVFKFGTTFKTTKSYRFPKTLEVLGSLAFQSPPIVLDVGASDGITSLHAIKCIDFKKYYITDLNTDVLCERREGKCYFYDVNNNCILIVTKAFVLYSSSKNSIFPFNIISDYFFSKSHRTKNAYKKIEIINPEVKKCNKNIEIKKYNLFERWAPGKVDLIISANILNRCYFSDNQIIMAVNNFVSTLNNGGRFVIVENTDIEKGTIFQVLNKKIKAEKDINGGIETRELILNSNR